MKKLVALSVLSAAMLSSMTAHAATAELKLIGTITPSACVPNFAGGGTINYGNIPASSLNASAQTMLPVKTTTVSVVCDSPVKFAFTAIDERAGTSVDTLTIPNMTFANGKFGLGTAPGGVNIGAYSIQFTGGTSNLGPVSRLWSSNNGVSWASFSGVIFHTSGLFAWNDGVTAGVPGALTSLTADVTITAALDKASNLPLTNEIAIDGLTTFEVVYL
jgi:hypothetical protein